MKITLYSIIFWLKDASGHNLTYNMALEKTAQKNGWNFEALIPKKCEIQDLSPQWKKKLVSLFLSFQRL